MPTDNYMVGKTTNAAVRFVREQHQDRRAVTHDATATLILDGQGNPFVYEEEVTVREWDVTDPHARNVEAGKILEGEMLPRTWAQWFIDADRNAAAFCIYRIQSDVGVGATR